MKGVEFYNSPTGAVIIQKGVDTSALTEQSEVIDYILSLVKTSYVGAYEALDDCYKKSRLNRPFHRYQMASRFIRCNCGAYDTLKMDIDEMGRLNIEQVPCPLRGTGDCIYENVICNPTRVSMLAPRQLELSKLLSEGHSNSEISEIMCISIATVHNVINQIKSKLNIKNTGEIVTWYNFNHG